MGRVWLERKTYYFNYQVPMENNVKWPGFISERVSCSQFVRNLQSWYQTVYQYHVDTILVCLIRWLVWCADTYYTWYRLVHTGIVNLNSKYSVIIYLVKLVIQFYLLLILVFLGIFNGMVTRYLNKNQNMSKS